MGWVSAGDPRYSGTMHMMFEILLQAYGWDKGWDILCRIAANVQTFEKGASTAAKNVSIGQAAFGLAIDTYAFIEIDRYGRARLGFVMPQAATVVTPDGIAILKNAPNPDLAALFVDYVMSDGQKLWILKKGAPGGPAESTLCRLPVDSTLYSLDTALMSVTENPFHLKASFMFDSRLSSRRYALLGDLIASIIITPHADLKRCGQAAARRGLGPLDFGKYFTTGMTEQEALAAADWWGKAEFAGKRIRLMNQWAESAKRRYRSIGK
jgi:hypothetical protein